MAEKKNMEEVLDSEVSDRKEGGGQGRWKRLSEKERGCKQASLLPRLEDFEYRVGW